MIKDWLKDPKSPQVFCLFGYAGTGKTTLAKEIASEVNGEVVFGAYTGKAAQVLISKGCPGAQTIHSMIYTVTGEVNGQPIFAYNHMSDIDSCKLIIIDECSMIDEEMGMDLLRKKKKILVLGDPAQLPPISGAGFFTNRKPDWMLTEIHRQAKDNPIIALSIAIREKQPLQLGTYGDSKIIPYADLTDEMLVQTDQMLVGTNASRRQYNKRIREKMGFIDQVVMPGEKIICLRNDYSVNIFNGTTWLVDAVKKAEFSEAEGQQTEKYEINIHATENAEEKKLVRVFREFFVGEEDKLTAHQKKKSQHFTHGYAITCHKSQGSQWDNILVLDQSTTFREEGWRWLYTAVTRAAKTLTLVKPF